LRFCKMHGCGNDYIYINCVDEASADFLPEEERPAFAVKYSDRHFGIGSDGLICVCASNIADFRMDMYNADGSRAEMCGNGIRCLCKYVFDKGLTDKTTLSIETAAGVRSVKLLTETQPDGADVVDGAAVVNSAATVVGARVYMGTAEVFENRPVTLEYGGKAVTRDIIPVSVGNPHAVIFTDADLDGIDLAAAGPLIENHKAFPWRTNVEFVSRCQPYGGAARSYAPTEKAFARKSPPFNISADTPVFTVRVWERGSGETYACGTGAAAVFAAASKLGYCAKSAVFSLKGGELLIERGDCGELYLTGPAERVFDGEI